MFKNLLCARILIFERGCTLYNGEKFFADRWYSRLKGCARAVVACVYHGKWDLPRLCWIISRGIIAVNYYTGTVSSVERRLAGEKLMREYYRLRINTRFPSFDLRIFDFPPRRRIKFSRLLFSFAIRKFLAEEFIFYFSRTWKFSMEKRKR